MNLSQFQEPIRHGRGPHAGPAQARDHGGEIVSPVEAVFELGEVARDMLAVDGAVGANNGGLDIAERGVDPLEGRYARRCRTGSSLDGLVAATGVGHTAETLEPVADDRAAWIEAPLGERGDRLAAETGDPTQLQANRLALRRRLDRGDERCLSRRASSSLAAGSFAAEVGIVNLDTAAQLLGRISLHHDLRELVLDCPSRGLRHAKASATLNAGDALLGLGHVIHGAKPGAQRQFGRGEDRPGNRRGLPAASGALKEITGLHHAVLSAAAGWTLETIRPSRRDNHRPALLLAAVLSVERWFAKPFLELHRVASHQHPSARSPCLFFVCAVSRAAEQGA